MSFVNNGLEHVRDLFKPTVTAIKVGDDNTVTGPTMNDLVSTVFTDPTPENVNGDSIAKSTHRARLTVADGNGDDLQEVGLFETGGDMILRETHPIVAKDATFEVLYEVTVEVKNP